MSKTRLALIALLGVCFTWGAAFVLMKDAIEKQPYMDFLAMRFTLAALAMFLLRPKTSANFERGDLKIGLSIGVVLAFGYITQTIGLELTTAATSGFLTGLYVIFTPLMAWIFYRAKVSGKLAIGAAISLVGLAVFSGAAESLEFQIGQLWLVLGAVLYGLHILLLGKYGHGRNAYRFAMVQISAVAVICWGFAIGDGIQWPPSDDVRVAIIFTAVLSTAAAFWIQTWAQTLMDASRAALIMTSEVAFTAIIAIAAGQEPITVAVTVGGALMLAAMLIVEWPSKKNPLELEPHIH
ncbi:DMT family transporter [Aquiluna borgnonia]|uniref:DMT family transporter n=1 Tax=Aquiluna borgnonia TaxID=2499157 RepID=A0A7D4TIJ5_9MICO|nr:DMT family transporter [Aquiluna borgnonia]QKJ24911.1 DMT family transporter [Aquiluna borgnonia]